MTAASGLHGDVTKALQTLGVAVTAEGKAEASMGVDAGDANNDGHDDLFVTEQTAEGHNLYINDGHGGFEDASARWRGSTVSGPTWLPRRHIPPIMGRRRTPSTSPRCCIDTC